MPAWHNLGNLYGELLQLDEGDRCYEKALASDPDHVQSHVARAMTWLLRGQFADGWPEYQWRRRLPGQGIKETGKPMWDGSSLEGKTILLTSEQGAG